MTGVRGGDPDDLSLLRFVDASLSARLSAYSFDGLQPFHPFALAPGHERWIVIRARFVHCGSWAEQTVETFTAQAMQFTFLGIHRAAQVVLPYNLEVNAPPDSGCPEPRPSG